MKRELTIASILLMGLISVVGCKPQVKDVVLKTTEGKAVNFAKLKKHWVVLNYWASWCEPCQKEIPELNAFAKAHKNVWLLAVNYDGVDEENLNQLIARSNIQYPSLDADPSDVLALGDIPGIPATFVFSPDGRLYKKLYGPQTQASLAKVISG